MNTAIPFSDLLPDIRRQFPALSRGNNGQPFAYLDGPAGTQVPQRVIGAMSQYFTTNNANHGGLFATSEESDKLLDDAHAALADFLGADDPACVAFGQNMTSLTFALSRALGRTWKAGDEILLSRLEHDANFTPWVLAARDAGATVKYVDIHRDDCTLNLDDFRAKLSSRTKLVAIGGASNAVGTINPLTKICGWAREAGAVSFVDAVHYAPHVLVDVNAIGCDLLACSTYKFFGPHLGVLWGKRQLLEELPAYKLRTAPDDLPGRWMTGTQSHESIIGAMAAIEYLADLGRTVAGDASQPRRAALASAYTAIVPYEQQLVTRLLTGLIKISGVKIYGITDLARVAERTSTVSITHARHSPEQLARHLASRGIFAWNGNYYALPLTETLGVEPDGMLRLGLVHYNTAEEVDRTLAALAELAPG